MYTYIPISPRTFLDCSSILVLGHHDQTALDTEHTVQTIFITVLSLIFITEAMAILLLVVTCCSY